MVQKIDINQIEQTLENAPPEEAEAIRQQLVQVSVSQIQTPLKWFTPTGAQHEWIKMIGCHKEGLPRSKFFSGANKVLKTGATVACLGNIIWGPQNDWFDYPIFRNWPYPKTVWIDSEDSTLKEIFIPEMYKWFPKNKFEAKAKGKTFDYHWVCKGKDGTWNIYIKTYDTPAKKLESSLIGLCIFSEPPPRDHYYAIPARLAAGGMVWNEFTPLVDAAWFHDDLMGDVEVTDSRMYAPHFWERAISKKLEMLKADAESACKEHGTRGKWDHATIQQNIADYDPDERDARAHGEFVHLRGRVFKTYDESVHVIDPYTLSSLTQYWFVIDPHERRYPFAKWYAILPNDEMGHRFELVYEKPEYEVGSGFETLTDCPDTIETLCASYLRFEEEAGIHDKIVDRIMDKQFGSKEYAKNRRTVQETYAQHGISCRFPQAFYIDVGHNAIKEALKCDETREHPLYRIRSTCMNTRRAYLNYKFKNQRRKDGATLGIEVEEKFKDPIDCDRYFFTEEPKYKWGWKAKQLGWRGRLARKRAGENHTCGSYF